MDAEKMNRIVGRIFTGFVVAAAVGGAAFCMFAWSSMRIYQITAQYLLEHDCYAD